MKIIRDGKEFVLTDREMIDAYYEQQLKWDMEYISGELLDDYNEDGDYDEIKEALKNEKMCEKVAYKYRKFLSIDPETELECLIDAYHYFYVLERGY